MNDQQKVKEFLARQEYMVVAVTLCDGTPWAVPVKLQRQEGAVFEWDSKRDTEHSRAIAAQPVVALTLFEKTDTAQLGIYITARAALVEETKPGFGRYRTVAERAWLNDETFVKRPVEIG